MLSSLRVLIVEDAPDLANFLALLLKLWGYETAIAYDGPAALEIVATFQPQVVLLDVGLPGMDGWELAQRLRRLPGMEASHLITLTGQAQRADMERSREAGIASHLVKPVEPGLLKGILAEAVRSGRGPRSLPVGPVNN